MTLVPQDGGGVRLMCNRDERRDRAAARMPERTPAASRSAVYPVDPAGGGSWVGVNDAGLAVALLNGTAQRARFAAATFVSRGVLVPRLLGASHLDEVAEVLRRLDPAPYLPFRIVAAQAGAAIVARSRGVRVSVDRVDASRPNLFTSSSSRPLQAASARRALFRRLVLAERRDPLQAQSAFHQHHWKSDPEISVVMARPDARTVSRTRVDVRPGAIRLTYEPLDPDRHADSCHVRL